MHMFVRKMSDFAISMYINYTIISVIIFQGSRKQMSKNYNIVHFFYFCSNSAIELAFSNLPFFHFQQKINEAVLLVSNRNLLICNCSKYLLYSFITKTIVEIMRDIYLDLLVVVIIQL